MIAYGQKPYSVNDTRSVLDDLGNSAFVAIGKFAPRRWSLTGVLRLPHQPACLAKIDPSGVPRLGSFLFHRAVAELLAKS